jgi:TRAP-type C4-dicarboxylate transport system substrate-binding protein
MSMNRGPLTGGIAMIGAGLLATAAQAQSPEVELTVVHGSPNTHVIAAQGVEPWMECVKEATGGRVGFKYFPAGQISGTPELLQALNKGVADLVPIPIGYESGKMPLNGVSMLPGLGSTAQDVIDAYSQAVDSGPLAEEFAANEAVPIWVMAFPPYQIVSTGGPITSLDDFSGKVIRSAGGTMNLTISALGASPAEIPVGDMYVALERGTVDGTISALASLKPFNVHEVMKAVSTNGAFGTFANVFSIRADKWKALPADVQDAMRECGAQTEASIADFLDSEAEALAQEFAGTGIEVYEFTPEQLQAVNERLSSVSEDWVSRLSGRGLPAEEVLQSYTKLVNGQ